eukprot:366399-Chlamydomonas_euryale.AAC.16
MHQQNFASWALEPAVNLPPCAGILARPGHAFPWLQAIHEHTQARPLLQLNDACRASAPCWYPVNVPQLLQVCRADALEGIRRSLQPAVASHLPLPVALPQIPTEDAVP